MAKARFALQVEYAHEASWRGARSRCQGGCPLWLFNPRRRGRLGFCNDCLFVLPHCLIRPGARPRRRAPVPPIDVAHSDSQAIYVIASVCVCMSVFGDLNFPGPPPAVDSRIRTMSQTTTWDCGHRIGYGTSYLTSGQKTKSLRDETGPSHRSRLHLGQEHARASDLDGVRSRAKLISLDTINNSLGSLRTDNQSSYACSI